MESLMKHLSYINFELDNNKHSNKKWTIQTYYHFKSRFNIDNDNTTINAILDEYARNLPLKFVIIMYKVSNLEVNL